MTRSEAVTYLDSEFQELQEKAGVLAADAPSGYQYVIDAALRGLETDEDEVAAAVVGAADTPGFLALLDYHALVRFEKALALKVDASTADSSVKYNQLFQNVRRMREDAEGRAVALGLLPGSNSYERGSINLDFLEPEQAGL